MLLTGSRALSHYLCKPNSSDWDFIASEAELNKLNLSFDSRDYLKVDNVEFLNKDCLNNNVFIGSVEVLPFIQDNNFRFNYNICTIKELYIQKRSHIYRSRKFPRDITYLQLLKKECLDLYKSIPGLDNPILKDRIKLTKQKYGSKNPNLNQSNESFFDDYVTKYFNHDDLHRLMAHYDEPIYEKLKINSELAKCEKFLWDNLSYEDKVKCVQEECYVIALERKIIPDFILDKPHMPCRISFDHALSMVCTTLTGGWFRDFAIDNWANIRCNLKDFISEFKRAYYDNRIKKFSI